MATDAAAEAAQQASSASRAAPSASTESSNTASAEWLNGAVAGSAPGGHAPSMMNAPGTCSSTKEKSSAPVIGLGCARQRSSPSTSATTSAGELRLGLGR